MLASLIAGAKQASVLLYRPNYMNLHYIRKVKVQPGTLLNKARALPTRQSYAPLERRSRLSREEATLPELVSVLSKLRVSYTKLGN